VRRFLSLTTRLDRASLIRHLAICAATATAFIMHQQLRFGNRLLGLIALAVAFNLLITQISHWPPLVQAARVLSPVLGIASWATLAGLTGGVTSPFIAGFWLEVLLSGLTFPGRGTVLVTGTALSALWAQQAFVGLERSFRFLALQSGFLAAMGAVTVLLTSQWRRAQRDLSRSHAELRNRLRALERETEVVRKVGKAGENVARLAHSLKNAVRAMRGFTTLIEEELSGSEREGRALDGLRNSIDHLEEVARATLGGRASPGEPAGTTNGVETIETIEEVIREVSISYPQVSLPRRVGEPLPSVGVPRSVLREVLGSLVRNAAEAMNGRGDVLIETYVLDETFEIQIRDQGGGLAGVDLQQIFTPGYTTKPDGSGFGLFLARRLLESYGGFVSASALTGGGALFSIELPIRRS